MKYNYLLSKHSVDYVVDSLNTTTYLVNTRLIT